MMIQRLVILFILVFFFATSAVADERYVLHYDAPAKDSVAVKDGAAVKQKGRGKKGLGFIQTALPLGNGRLGAMFSGGIDTEHLVINDITLWMNSKRGQDEIAQSGTRTGGRNALEKVRQAYREGKYGTKPDSMESLATKELSTKSKLGNYAPFTDVMISVGHDADQVKDYRRQLDARTGLGTVSYSIGAGKFKREFFCSFPDDVVVGRFTAEAATMDLVLMTSSKHKQAKVTSAGNKITLVGAANMLQDNIDFMQLIHVDAGDGEVEAKSDGTIKISNATEVTFYLAGYCDYLPVYPAFKGRDYRGDCEKAIEAATSKGYDTLKQTHVDDVLALMNRCGLELDFESKGVTTDKLISGGGGLELENLYFNYSRYLQMSCSRGAPVPSNLQGLWNDSLKPPWNCDYHNDINVQMNYWMVDSANLSESFAPFAKWTKVLSESGVHTAKGNVWDRQRLERGAQRKCVRFHGSECTWTSLSARRPLAGSESFRSLRLYSGSSLP